MGNGAWGAIGEVAASFSTLHLPQCPMPNAQFKIQNSKFKIQNSTITGVWSLGWVNFLGSASMMQLVARSYSMGVR
jgi:hypothetical protein